MSETATPEARQSVTLLLPPDVVRELDERALRATISRAAVARQLLAAALQKDGCERSKRDD
jgi:hypothetical protein